jgi:predicted Zn finger-like uncharacterized protein
MIIRCDNCSVSLQLDDAKVPAGNFSVRCPRCENMLRVNANGGKPSAVKQMASNTPAPEFEGNSDFARKENSFEINKAMRALLGALQSDKKSTDINEDEDGKPRRILLCMGPNRRALVAGNLAQNGYKVFTAETPAQANERLREGKTEILVFSPDFASDFGGAAILQQKLNAMPAAERRRLFVVSLDETGYTLNAHEAFLRNLNLIVHVNDVEQLSLILNRSLRDYNILYRHYNEAIGLEVI